MNGPSKSLRDRVLANAKAEPKSVPYLTTRFFPAAVAMVVAFGFLVAFGFRADVTQLPQVPLVVPAVAAAAGSAILLALALSRGTHMLGVSVSRLALATLLVPVLVGAIALAATTKHATTPALSTFASALSSSLYCDVMSLVLAVPVFLAAAWARRPLLSSSPSLTGATLGAAAATVAHFSIHLHCPANHPVHTLVGHMLPALPMTLLGALVFSRWPVAKR